MGDFGGTGLLLSLMLLSATKAASNEFSKIMADEESGIAITTKESTAAAMSDVTATEGVSMTNDAIVTASNTTHQVTTPKMHTTTKPLPTPPLCLNGGTLINGVCHCLGNFEGSKCESYSSLVTIDSTDLATEVKVKINEIFHEEYTDPQSFQYKEFVQDFTKKMDLVYRVNITNYLRLNITKISNGSVVVEHEVVVNITNGPNITETVNQIPERIEEALSYCMAGKCPGIEFLETPTVVKQSFSSQLICDQHIPKEYRNYYTAIMETGGITCVSLCNSKHNNTKNCNTGECRIMNTGPTCNCPEGYWYSGTDCYGPIQKVAVFSVTGVLAAVLVIFVMTSIICMVYKGKQSKRLKGSQDDQMTEWLEDDFNWSSSHKGSGPVGFSREFSTENKLPFHNNTFDGWQFDAQRHLQSLSSGSVTGSSYNGPQQYLTHKRPDSVYQSFYGQK